MSLGISLLDPSANPELYGHDEAVNTLERALASGRLHHGWLFHGPTRDRQGDARLSLRPHPSRRRGEPPRA